MGDQSIPYARVEAGLAIGFRLGTSSFLAPPGILFGEPDLKFLIEPFGVHVASVFVPFFGIFVPSDDRIKTNETALDTGQCLSNLARLSPKSFSYIDEWAGASTGAIEEGSTHTGFVAQELGSVLPSAIRESTILIGGEEVTDFNEYNLQDLFPEIVGAVQEVTGSTAREIARNRCLDPWSTSPRTVPAAVDAFCTCTDTAWSGQLACFCSELTTLCAGAGSGWGGCGASDPLKRACGLSGVSSL